MAADRNVLDLYRDHERLIWPIIAPYPPRLRDDAEQAARIGLRQAARTWNPDRSKFPTWARRRIRWEVQEEMRRQDWLSRSDRTYLDRWREWMAEQDVWPSQAEQAAAGFDVKRVERLSASLSHLIPDTVPYGQDVEGEALANIAADAILDTLATLPPTLWATATLRWVDEWSVSAIARYYGLSESRIYQRLTHARNLLTWTSTVTPPAATPTPPGSTPPPTPPPPAP